jgi:hypothetical protein
MTVRTPLVFLTILLSLLGCSGESTDKQTSKPETNQELPPPIKTKASKPKPTEPYPNNLSIQDLQPDLHLSGVQTNHASGAIFSSDHVSGQ